MMYGCHSQPRPSANTGYLAQAGWTGTFHDGKGVPHRVPVYREFKHVMSTDCRYDVKATDKQCAGCPHIEEGKEKK